MCACKINWTEEMKQFILDNYYDLTSKQLTELINTKFGLELKWTAVAAYKKRNNLRNGLPKHWEKGHVPHNKGEKMTPEQYEKSAPTMFKKGQAPINYRPVGSERITKDGYIQIKVKDPRTWKLKHRVVWEKENGPIPKNCALLFLDGDKKNCELSNLKLVSRSELLVMNRYHMFQETPELNDAASNLARVINIANEESRKRGNR